VLPCPLPVAEDAKPQLSRSIRLGDAVAVTINGIIGGGIFGLPAPVFALVGNYSLFSFAACGVAVSLVALAFAEVASRFSGTGGPYLYAREAYGSHAGFAVGWLTLLARLTAFAANCNLLLDYLGAFHGPLASGWQRALFIAILVGSLVAINCRGVRETAVTGNALVVGKLAPLVLFALAGLFFMEPGRFEFVRAPGYDAFAKSVMLSVYAFTGFEMLLIPGGEVKQPQRNLPLALLAGMSVVVTLYLLIQAVCAGTLPGLTASARPLADAAAIFLGTWGAAMITAGLAISIVGNLNVLILASSRLVYAMAESGELPATLSQVHPRFHTPVRAILTASAVMLALALSGTFIYLLTISTLARLSTYVVVCSALPVLRRRKAPPAHFRAPWGDAIAVAGCAVSLWLFTGSNWGEVRDTALALCAGWLVYALSRHSRAWFDRANSSSPRQ